MRTVALVVAAGLVVGACASPSQKASVASHSPAATGSCIHVDTLEDWQPVDDQSILIFEPGSPRSHLVTLPAPIEGLWLAENLVIKDGDLDGLICANGTDEILIEEGSCISSSIASIEYLSENRTAELVGKALTIL